MTARTGSLHCKVFEPSTLSGATILLDLHDSGYDQQGEPHRSELAILAAVVSAGPTREYWIAAEERPWNIVPTHRDAMMNERVKGKSTFTAYAYRPYSADFAKPLAPARC